jgi:predicted nucleic acid-binding OB-fold protein
MDYDTKIKHYVIKNRKQKMFTSLKKMIRNIKSVTDKELQKRVISNMLLAACCHDSENLTTNCTGILEYWLKRNGYEV